MADRVDLQRDLERILGSRNVYFQPPESVKINYPAIVYSLSAIDSIYADNRKYRLGRQYTVTLIDQDPDSDIIDKIMEFRYCSFDTSFRSDNLNHFVFTLFY